MIVKTPDSPEPEQLLSMKDVARLLKVGKRTLQTWLASGKMPAADLRIGKTRRWSPRTIYSWIEGEEQL